MVVVLAISDVSWKLHFGFGFILRIMGFHNEWNEKDLHYYCIYTKLRIYLKSLNEQYLCLTVLLQICLSIPIWFRYSPRKPFGSARIFTGSFYGRNYRPITYKIHWREGWNVDMTTQSDTDMTQASSRWTWIGSFPDDDLQNKFD